MMTAPRPHALAPDLAPDGLEFFEQGYQRISKGAKVIAGGHTIDGLQGSFLSPPGRLRQE